jgi:hypothetical protein
MKSDHLIYQTGQFDLPCFEQELPALVRFVCEHILTTLLWNLLLQARQALRSDATGDCSLGYYTDRLQQA